MLATVNPHDTTVSEQKYRVVEVHNCYTLYELNSDGSQAKQPLLSFGNRPQDWGHPRWHYYFCKIFVAIGKTQYFNNCHIWQEVERSDLKAYQKVAPALFMVLQPGQPRELCDRSHLDIDDFWEDSWGKMPPYYNQESDEDYEQDYEGEGEYVDPVPVGGKIYSWRIYHSLQPRRLAEKDSSPIADDRQWQYLIDLEDEKGGFLIATLEKEKPSLDAAWREKGWIIEFHGELEKLYD
jgi:hypothetical protein